MQIRSVLLVYLLSPLSLLSHAFPLIPQDPPTKPAIRRRVAYSVVAVDGGSAATSPPANGPPVQTIIQTSDQTETVTALASTPLPSTETVVSTTMVNESQPAKTVNVSITEIITKAFSPTSQPSYKVVNADDAAPFPAVDFVTKTSTALTTVDCTSSSSSTFSTSSTAIPITTSKISLITIVPSTPPQYAKPATETGPPAEAGWVAPAGLLPTPSSNLTSHITQPTTTSKTYDDGMWHTTWRTWNATWTMSSSLSTTATAAWTLGHWKK
ncbi:hypothetical protein ABVK25_006627 [Lepraria finkii]|uniref:Uncharacterized protein n=1 Tax=Lepraria finkii TaxID=1340010 RepID=A0ABR4B5D9_9LECA